MEQEEGPASRLAAESALQSLSATDPLVTGTKGWLQHGWGQKDATVRKHATLPTKWRTLSPTPEPGLARDGLANGGTRGQRGSEGRRVALAASEKHPRPHTGGYTAAAGKDPGAEGSPVREATWCHRVVSRSSKGRSLSYLPPPLSSVCNARAEFRLA